MKKFPEPPLDCSRILKRYHQGTTFQIMCESGAQQDDILGTSLLRWTITLAHSRVANCRLAVLAIMTGYGDKFFLGDMVRALFDFEENLRGANLQLNASESASSASVD